ncbi:hypothetical protein C8F04DRAFT_1060191 [Mycena alexandri]|uniref:Response regulatory domain-containing protein n=1 Tax=Mycena alexandri TaxID=1745969 RepID=A0AAD6XCY7_9AGAR|nr:hypothetical protein C8F04DRAFT_1060191 [Mycena alexandri]
MAEDPPRPEVSNGDAEWTADKEQSTFTFVRRQDSSNQPSTPPTPIDHHDESDMEPEDRQDTPTNSPPRQHPRFTRAFSLPQLGRLQNPHRNGRPPTHTNGNSDPGTPSDNQFYELSLELADMVQMAIQTLLQISPPQVLEPTREQFSACALSVPTPSMSAMFTAMRNLNYFSANMAAFCQEPPDEVLGPSGLIAHTNFDLGELLQSVGDVMSGAAAEAGVDLVLYHGDLSLKYAWVSGSESGLTVALSHVLRQIMSVAHAGDAIEVGLFIGFSPVPGQEITISDDLVTADALASSPVTEEGPIRCAIQIAHKFAASNPYATEPESREEPHFSSLILRRLLRQIGGALKHDVASSSGGRSCELSLALDRAPPISMSPTETPGGGTEPTLEELAAFADTLKGAKVALYASSKGSFAQHVTRYLVDWGMDVSHMSADGDADGDVPSSSPSSTTSSGGAEATLGPQRLSFVFIDDDVSVLKERLDALRIEQPYQLTLNPKRPPLPHHSRRSTTQVPQISRMMSPIPASTSSVVIVHFTSLANFKVVKEVLQSVLTSYLGTSGPVPEVMIVPKPAGPQRVLTQLHMAFMRPPVDPFFSPIATSPATPASSFLGYTGHPSNRSPAGSNRPPSARSNSDRSSRSTKEMLERANAGLPPPSPLGMSNSTEYFSEDAVQLGSTPSSGLLISSPPGQPAGIFFSPRSKTPKKSAFGPPMERDRGQLVLPPSSRRTSISRVPSDNPTFSSLHKVAEEESAEEAAPRPSSSLSIGIPTTPGVMDTTVPAITSDPVLPPLVVRTDSKEMTIVAGQQQSGSPSSSPQMSSPTFRRPMRRRTATPDSKVLGKTKAAPDVDIVPPISVLIVEDNVVNQMQLAGFMRKKKLKYEVAKNGLEAVEKWKTGNFDLILMDIQMPVMDGIDATKEIRRLEKLNAAEGYPPASPTVPQSNAALSLSPYTSTGASPYRSSVIIVAQTASSLNSDRVKALAAGCNDFLTKPVNHHWLNNKVTEWGSIKALQMWADMPPLGGQQNGLAHNAKAVAERLHVPEPHGKRVAKVEPEADPGASTSAGGVSAPTTGVASSTSSAFWSPGMPSPVSFWETLGIPEPARKLADALPLQSTNHNYPDSPSTGETKESYEPAPDATADVPPDAPPPSDILPGR